MIGLCTICNKDEATILWRSTDPTLTLDYTPLCFNCDQKYRGRDYEMLVAFDQHVTQKRYFQGL